MKAINSTDLLAGLPPERLRWRCDPATIPFETTATAEPVTDLVGQERAFRALKMGVELTLRDTTFLSAVLREPAAAARSLT